MSFLVAIDAGHGSNTAGKRTPDDYREHWINVNCAYYCNQYLLNNTNYIKTLKVAWNDTNSKDDADTPLTTRQNIIKSTGCDFSISFHANAYGDGASYNSANGVETLIHSTDAYKNDSLRYAEIIQSYIIKGTSQSNRGVKEQVLAMCQCDAMGVKAAALVEIGFMTNLKEANLMKTNAFCKEQGEDVAKGIIAYIQKYYGSEISSSTSTNNLYRVRKSWDNKDSQLGAYAELENAKEVCDKNSGYTVYDWNGNAVYGEKYSPNTTTGTTSTIKEIYRIRKSWTDVASQIGAYSNLDSAKSICDKNAGYTVYNWNGNAVYGTEYKSVISSITKYYRVRKSWDDKDSQLGAYAELENAKEKCDQNPGYTVYDWNGNAIYTKSVITESEDTEKEKEEVSDKTESPTESTKDVVETPVEESITKPVIISPLYGYDHEAFLEYVGSRANKDMERSGILASVTTAQAILESGWGQSDLSLYANNLFGMKSVLSGNTWSSDWDGGIYTKKSPEEDENGNSEQVKSDFRAYKTVDESIKDHSDYLNSAMNGNKLRYDGLSGETDYRIAIQIIKDGGYATDSGYVDKLCNIIETYDLSKFDLLEEEVDEEISEIPEEEIEKPIGEVDEDDDTDKKLDEMNEKLDSLTSIVNVIMSIVEAVSNLLKKIFK